MQLMRGQQCHRHCHSSSSRIPTAAPRAAAASRRSRQQQLPLQRVAAPQAPQLLSSSEENGAGAVGTTGVLLVQCPDAKGVVAALAQLLFGFNCNILQSDQFSDETLAPSRFFQRIHFDFKDISVGTGNLAVLETAVADLAKRYQMDWRVRQFLFW
jgi:formyltetrahydrofolate deformylase